MTADQLFTFAVNTGKFYDTHVALAAIPAERFMWELHVKLVVLPEWRREFKERYEGLPLVDIEYVAAQLMSYYSDHVQESKA